MDKRYQVFVSSTYGDLREERQEVMQALLELDCIPAGMELFPAADDDQWTLIKRVIDDCDYYMLIMAGRYGSIGHEGKSYTQMEYEYALLKGKPVIAFLHADPGKIPAEKTDPAHHEALKAFRQIVQKKSCKQWTTAQELGSVVSRSIVRLIKDKPGVGWVRADRVPDDGAAQEILRLRQRLEAAEEKIVSSAFSVPEGTEQLAQGNERISLSFSGKRFSGDFKRYQVSFSWNELLANIGLLLLDVATDGILEGAIQAAALNKMEDAGQELASLYIRSEDYRRVMLQFRALRVVDKKPQVDGPSSWVLTPYGDKILSQAIAIRSGESTPLPDRLESEDETGGGGWVQPDDDEVPF